MKNLLFVFFILPFISCASNTDEDNICLYTERQLKALAVMDGMFENVPSELIVENRYYITFENQYIKPVHICEHSYMDGEIVKALVEGECIWRHHVTRNVAQSENISFYYGISPDASSFTLVYREGEKNEQVYKTFKLKVIDQTHFILEDEELEMSYDFVKRTR
ncbi:MAG: hypothetical protein LBN74_01430 [Prevotella sp.]|jgi:hypothetical protein|nr:hypothetical protein [Prevotella sp.]